MKTIIFCIYTMCVDPQQIQWYLYLGKKWLVLEFVTVRVPLKSVSRQKNSIDLSLQKPVLSSYGADIPLSCLDFTVHFSEISGVVATSHSSVTLCRKYSQGVVHASLELTSPSSPPSTEIKLFCPPGH